MKTLTTVISLISFSFSLNAMAGGAGNHHHMDHSKMDHSQMNHAEMGHSAKQGDHQHGNMGISVSGEPGKLSEVTKTIVLETVDAMRFNFESQPDVQSGDVVRFIVTNKGQINHEFSIGNAEEQKAHQAMMRKMPDMVHEDGNSITVKPGETRELIWKFKGDPKVVFACNIPGHAEAGMMHSMNVNQRLSSHKSESGSVKTVVD